MLHGRFCVSTMNVLVSGLLHIRRGLLHGILHRFSNPNILVGKQSSLSQRNMPPQQVRITSDDRGPLVNLASWITLVVVCLATLTKIATKLRKIGRPQGDDFMMFAAMV